MLSFRGSSPCQASSGMLLMGFSLIFSSISDVKISDLMLWLMMKGHPKATKKS